MATEIKPETETKTSDGRGRRAATEFALFAAISMVEFISEAFKGHTSRMSMLYKTASKPDVQRPYAGPLKDGSFIVDYRGIVTLETLPGTDLSRTFKAPIEWFESNGENVLLALSPVDGSSRVASNGSKVASPEDALAALMAEMGEEFEPDTDDVDKNRPE